MHLLLISPAQRKREGNIWQNIRSRMPPLGMAWVASWIEKQGHKVEILDLDVERLEDEAIVQWVRDRGTPDFIGIGAVTETVNYSLGLASLLGKAFPEPKIMMGGVHPTVMVDEVLANEHVDYVVRREGEITVGELVGGKAAKDIAGLSYREGGKIVNNPDRPMIEDLDSIPFPAYHLLPMKKYYPTVGAYKRLPGISMITTRGCPGKCTFCLGSMLGNRIRMHSTKYLVEQILLLQKGYGIREISFYDDTFTVFKKNVVALCEEILRRNIDITWSCFSRIDFVDEDILRLMKRAGCHQIMYGIESGSEEVLRNINKRVVPEKSAEAVRLTRKVGIDVRGAFMLGSPGDTEETIRQNIDFAVKLKLDIAIFNITTPYPGTQMFKWADENGHLRTKDWTKYDLSTAILEIPSVSASAVERLYKMAFRKFYMNPGYILRRILKLLRNPAEMKILFRAALGFLRPSG